MDIFFRIIGYLSIIILVISFAFMIKSLRQGRRLSIRSLIIPVLISIVILVMYSAILGVPVTVVSSALIILGLVLGIFWSRTTWLTVKGSSVYSQRSVWYVVIWGLSIVFTQFMVINATPELTSFGISTIYFSTGLTVSTNTGLLVRHLLSSRLSQMKIVCNSCGALNVEGIKFCTNCGQPLLVERG